VVPVAVTADAAANPADAPPAEVPVTAAVAEPASIDPVAAAVTEPASVDPGPPAEEPPAADDATPSPSA
jgi:hypothetical protein